MTLSRRTSQFAGGPDMPVTVFAFAVAFADGHSQADRDSRLARARPGRRVRSLKAREAGSCVVEIKMFLIIDVSSRNFLVVNDLQGVKVTPIHCKIERTRFPHQRLVPSSHCRTMEIGISQCRTPTTAQHKDIVPGCTAGEPMRILRGLLPAQPPKHYYATRWRGIIRRILERNSVGNGFKEQTYQSHGAD